MKLRLLLSTLTLLMLTSLKSNAQSTFYGGDPFSNDFYVMDSTTMLPTDTLTLTSSTGVVEGSNGLAAEICDDLYIAYKVSNIRYLGTVNVNTGVITEIGPFGDNVSNITFVNGILYGVTGDGASTPETLYTINTTTAAMTLAVGLGNGDDGEAITFNPDDGLIYHWSGWGAGSVIMETIDPVTFAITNITISGSNLSNVGSADYVGNNRFLVSDVNDDGIKYVTTTGVVSATANVDAQFKGLIFYSASPNVTNTTAANDSICAGETAVLVCDGGGTYEWFLDGVSTSNTNDTLNATVAGAYVCEVDNGVCVLASDTIFLTVSNVPTTNITPSPSGSICAGDSIELMINSGGGPVQVQWYLDGAMIAGATGTSYFANASGSYNATKTNQNGCTDSSAVATVITVNNIPTVNITPSPTVNVCDGDSVELMVSAGGGGGTYQWSMDGTDIVGATNSFYFASAAGSYNVLKTNMNGCSDSSATATVVNINPLPPVVLTPGPTVNFCPGDTVEITIAQGGGGGTYQWFMDGATISGATTNTYFATVAGAYNLEKTNMNGCSDTAAVATTLIDTCSNSLYELSGLSFDVYPNPASDFVTIDFNSFTNADITGLQLVGLDGKIVRLFNINEANANEISINISDVNTGVYFIRMTTSYGQIVKEIIIE